MGDSYWLLPCDPPRRSQGPEGAGLCAKPPRRSLTDMHADTRLAPHCHQELRGPLLFHPNCPRGFWNPEFLLKTAHLLSGALI